MREDPSILKVLLVAALVASTGHFAPGQRRTVSGIALDAACQPLPGVSIGIDRREPVLTDAKGRFEIAATGTPSVTLHAVLAGFRNVERVAEPWSGTRREERIFMLVGPLAEVLPVVSEENQRVVDPAKRAERPRLHGQVLDSNCQPLGHATIRLPSDGDLTTRTDERGHFSFDAVVSGTHDIEVIAPGCIRTVLRDFVIDRNNTGEVTIAMDRGTERELVTLLPK